jgi:hypothetical protein
LKSLSAQHPKLVERLLHLSLPPSPSADDDDDANVDRVTDTQPKAGAFRAAGRWTLEEDAKLTRVVANTPKKKWGKEYKINGMQLPRWFRGEWKVSVIADCVMS